MTCYRWLCVQRKSLPTKRTVGRWLWL